MGVGAVGGDVDDGVRDHALDQLPVDQRLATLHALPGPIDREGQGPLGRTDGAGADHQPLLGEPVAGQFEPRADLAQHGLRPDVHVLEGELGMLVDERVRVAGNVGDLHARGVDIDEEHRRGVLGLHVCQHDQIVGDVAHGDEPLLPVDHVAAVAVGRRGGQSRREVRSGTGFRDRDRVATVAARTRDQVALTLLGRRVRERVGRAPHGVPQRVGELAELVLDHHLLEDGQARAAELGRRVDRLQARVEHRRLDRRVRLGGRGRCCARTRLRTG